MRILYNFSIFLFHTFFRLLPFNILRINLLRILGAKIGKRNFFTRNCRFEFPWRLEIGNNCYFTDTFLDWRGGAIKIGDNCDISYNSILFTLSHDIKSQNFKIKKGNIVVKNRVWICARSIVLPNTILSEGSVLSTNSIFKGKMKKNSLYIGNIAKKVSDLPNNRSKAVRNF